MGRIGRPLGVAEEIVAHLATPLSESSLTGRPSKSGLSLLRTCRSAPRVLLDLGRPPLPKAMTADGSKVEPPSAAPLVNGTLAEATLTGMSMHGRRRDAESFRDLAGRHEL